MRIKIAAFALAASTLVVAATNPSVQTDKGVVTGIRKGDVRVFLGIPYSAPPVGSLRFRAPQPHDRWSTALLATKPRSSCPQLQSDDPAGAPSNNEDCLYLNIWTPSNSTSLRPVMFWIHGGGFTEGNGAAPQYDGTHLVHDTGVVLVTINYRVGSFGFLTSTALDQENKRHVSGNYGILDQQAALRWVKENIRSFGGDPGNVTIFGESAGAISVAAQLVSPEASGLFQRAIIQSSLINSATPPLADAETQWAAFVEKAGCKDSKDTAACLRALSVPDLLKVQTGMLSPVTDGYVLPLSPPEAFAAGKFNKVPVIVGSNAKEFYIFAAREETRSTGAALDWAGLVSRIERMPFRPSGVKPADVLASYPEKQFPNAVSELATIEGDALFACTTDSTLNAVSVYVPAYGYEIDIQNGYQQQILPSGNHLLPTGVSYHTTDLGYVFDNRNDASPLSGRDGELAHMIQGYWTEFAATGDPNNREHSMGPNWPRYKETHAMLKITDRPVLDTDFANTHHCALWNNER